MQGLFQIFFVTASNPGAGPASRTPTKDRLPKEEAASWVASPAQSGKTRCKYAYPSPPQKNQL